MFRDGQPLMSKAFTREPDTSADELGLDEADAEPDSSGLPEGTKNYITPLGAKKLRDELRLLLNDTRPEMVRTVSWAASNGDRSENGDYIYGKKRLREIDRRIRFLSKRLDKAEIIDPLQQKSTQILFGATVKVRDEEEQVRIYRIVGIDETDVKRGHVSWISPISKALLRGSVGETVTLRTPKGEEELEILEVLYVSIPESPSS